MKVRGETLTKTNLLLQIEARCTSYLSLASAKVRAADELINENLAHFSKGVLKLSVNGRCWVYNYKQELQLNGKEAAAAWAEENLRQLHH